jgi:hypothetical protein
MSTAEDSVTIAASLATLFVILGALLLITHFTAHVPCSHYANTAVRYVPLRCLNIPGSK